MFALDLPRWLAIGRRCEDADVLTDAVVTLSKPCLPLTVTFVPLGALSLTSPLEACVHRWPLSPGLRRRV